MRGVGGGGGILEEEGEKGRKQAGVKPLEHRRVWPSIFFSASRSSGTTTTSGGFQKVNLRGTGIRMDNN